MELGELTTTDSHEKGSRCYLVKADGSVSEAYVTVLGPDSKAFRMAKRMQRNELLSLREKDVDFKLHDFFPFDVTFCAAVTKDWGGITKNGKELAFTKKAYIDFLNKSPVNVDRILEVCGDRVNFTKAL